MEKETYQKEILERINADSTTTCEVCGQDSMITHAFVDHSTDKVKVMCNGCYFKRVSRDEN